jgi:Ca2+-binding EF-hand superfamily protein
MEPFMNRNLVLAAALLALAPATLLAGEGERKGDAFTRLDTNKDGVLTKDELQAIEKDPRQAKGAERIAASFDKLDRDKDGMVTQEEMREARTTRMAAFKEQAATRFREADKNSDGMLSKEETQAGMPRLAERFDKLDQNKDGQLSPEEMRGAGRHRERAAN